MEIMTQERYQEYRQQLRNKGFSVPETIVNLPDEKTNNILEERIGPMPWNLLKYPIKYADKAEPERDRERLSERDHFRETMKMVCDSPNLGTKA